ncbi:MAG: ACR3 family arsenite efflux transporter [Candidatus Zixiibacteriota bacterium]|nr:MAG: ACR3 family arsenite efflux transporter [candidate division Zixibacteria bacterium]
MKGQGLSFFEKYLTLWVGLSIIAGTATGYCCPALAVWLDGLSYAHVSIPIAVCLFFMMFPIMVKIDFSRVKTAARTPRPVALTLVINWLVKPFTMYAIAYFFLGFVFREFITGTEIVQGEQVEIYRSYISGAILLGIAPCTAMVLMWSYLSRGNDAMTLVMVALNSLLMLVLYAPLGGLLLSINKMPIPWQTIVLSVLIYVGLPLITGYYTRKGIIKNKGVDYFNSVFLHRLTPVAITALLVTLVVLFTLKGEILITRPFDIGLIALPLFVQTIFIFAVGYTAARLLRLRYEDAAPAAMIGASNHFEVAIATAVVLYGLNSGAAMATVVGVLIEVPVMLMLVRFCLRTNRWFRPSAAVSATDTAETSAPTSKGEQS